MNTKSIQKPTIRKKASPYKNTYSNIQSLVKSNVLGLDITNATTHSILEYIRKVIQETTKNIYVVTPNPEILLLSQKNSHLKAAINTADLALCDGMQLFNAARFLGSPLKERIIGTDFVESLCEKAVDWPITVGFLGGRPGVAEQVSECLKARYPGLKVVFAESEWNNGNELGIKNKELGKRKEGNTIIHNSKFIIPKIDILFVAFGAPKQELWMAEHVDKIPVRVMVGVGGAFDQIIHPSLRPPVWMHTVGLGWLYRLIREPWRIGRQIKLIQFLWLVLKEK